MKKLNYLNHYWWVLAASPPCPGWVHWWSLSRSPAVSSAFPCNTPGRVHQRSLSRSLVISSPSPWAPRPAYTYGTPVAYCFTSLSLPHPQRRARSGWTSREHKTRCGSFRDLDSVSYVDWSKSKTLVTKRPLSQIDGQCGSFRDLVSVSFFRWVVIWGVAKSALQRLFLSVSFVGLSSGGLQNWPHRDY
jgi:hypothetical protein